ncbi:MAG: winged helix-turn-helix transcriptional regulator, partial [Lachnospiraceae bacterium]|nr:winged helix-turn-helix transcriptional regulator [Lachnospiraceae bacterium]
IAVQLRRKNDDRTNIIEARGITLYIDRLTAIINDTEIRLTRTECAILKLLMFNADSPIGKTTILEKISYDTPDCTERSLKQHISNIRHKLGEAGGRDYIESVYGIGFRLIT